MYLHKVLLRNGGDLFEKYVVEMSYDYQTVFRTKIQEIKN